MSSGFKLVQLANGEHSIHSLDYGETMHPAIGPAQEAEALYVKELKICERLAHHQGEFVVWDVGTGGAANALTLLRCTRHLRGELHIVSFDNTLEPLRFAQQNASSLNYLRGYENVVEEFLNGPSKLQFDNGKQKVNWEMHVGDFPTLLSDTHLPAPHAIFFDPFSPKKNPTMWTQKVFCALFKHLDTNRPCSLATYSRSTMIRVALFLAGFYVAIGKPTGQKEETTIAANQLELLDRPLDRSWLDKAQRSDGAEPLNDNVYRQAKLTAESLAALKAHPQFK